MAMEVRRVGEVPRNERGDGQVSHLLLGLPGDGVPMSVTLVTAAPGSQQPVHVHPDSTQVYVVVAGTGRMIAGDEEADVSAGSMIRVPPGTRHAIRNTGDEQLTYVSVTVPPFPVRIEGSAWLPAD
jgi:mannose-6-phosphate isomerase-like protein (cupin superfamily)